MATRAGKSDASYLKCMVCSTRMPIQRHRSSKRRPGHAKDLYCTKCKKTTKHVEEGE